MQTAGDLQPFSERPFAHRNLVFPIHTPPNTNETIFLRVKLQGSITVPILFWQHDALHHHDQNAYAVLCLYLGSLIALGLYNLLLYTSTRDKVFLAYNLCSSDANFTSLSLWYWKSVFMGSMACLGGGNSHPVQRLRGFLVHYSAECSSTPSQNFQK